MPSGKRDAHMPLDAFAPYRLAPGALPEEGARAAAALAAEPLVASAGEPLPSPLVNRALAEIAAGRAATAAEACRAADGSVAGMGGPPRACLSSDRHRARVADAARAALAAGFAGVCLDGPDAPLAIGILGAGFCPDCQRAFARHLVRAYGEHFQPVDYLALAREAVAQAPGAVTFERLPFGRDFWRMRHDALERAVFDYARAARDASRAAGKAFHVVAQFEALGPAQLRASRHVDAAIFPAPVPAGASGIGLFRLLRAVMGHRPAAVAPVAPSPPGALARLAAVAATCGIEISGLEPSGSAGQEVASVRRLARQLGAAGRGALSTTPIVECAVLYSAEADLWSGGRHRIAVERAGEVLAARHVQAPVVTRLQDAPPEAAVVLAGVEGLPDADVKELRRRLDAGGAVLTFGEVASLDESGRAHGGGLPSGKPSGVRVGAGTLAELPALAQHGGEPAPPELVEKGLVAVLGKGRRAAGLWGRDPVLVIVDRTDAAVHVHLVALGGERVQGATLFIGVKIAGGVRRGRFVASEGTDVRIPMNPSGTSLSTVLPAFRGYAVLSLAP